MKLEENMYVRTKYGRIAKIEEIEDDTAFCDNWLWQSYEEHIDFINLKDEEDVEGIIKASFNIIDLIEVGDYVNGQIVTQIIPNNRKKEPSTMVYTGINYFVGLYNEEIKSIVTHEQMEQMSYKLGE